MSQKMSPVVTTVIIVVVIVVVAVVGFRRLGGSGLSHEQEDKYLKPLQLGGQASAGGSPAPSVMPPQPGGGTPTLAGQAGGGAPLAPGQPGARVPMSPPQ